MEVDLTEIEESNDVATLEERRERKEDGGAYSHGRSLLLRHKGKVALAAAGLIALGVAWKLGYVQDVIDAVKSARSRSERPSQSRVSVNAAAPVSNPVVASPQLGVCTAPKMPFSVGPHVRNLHDGWTNSPKNRALAEKHGVSLMPNQSYIPAYEKYRDAA